MKNIVFTGIDGSGKSSCAEWFSSYLKSKKIPTCIYSGKGDLQNKELLCLLKDRGCVSRRMEYISLILDSAKKIMAVNESSMDVINIWDRYHVCLQAYYHAMGVFDREFEKIFDWMPRADLFIFLDVKPENAIDRIISRGHTKELETDLAYLKKVRKEYVRLLEGQNTIYIDANQTFDSVKGCIEKSIEGIL